MDLNQHIEKIVESIIADISANVAVKVDSVISNAINNRLNNFDYSTYIKEAVTQAFEKRVSEYQIDQRKLESRIAEKITNTIDQVHSNTQSMVSIAVENHIAKVDFQQAMANSIGLILANRLKDYDFPAKSINATAIKFDDFKLSGDLIQGGIIQNFSSTGIDDRSTNVALTILDDVTVVENNLLTKDLTVEGSMTINGEFVVNGNVDPESAFYKNLLDGVSANALAGIDQNLFSRYSSLIFNKFQSEGIDLNKITINGTEVIKNNQLGSSIVESNLQKLGQLKELQVAGETLLSETFYVTNKRVGINTIEPSAALSVWDDEVEIVAQKRQKDTGLIGTQRNQKLMLSANGKENIVLETDGSVSVNSLNIGSIKFTTESSAPNYVSSRGHIVWNSNPNPGGPMGWICLGGANWANFGIID